jgi:hypothetical protein
LTGPRRVSDTAEASVGHVGGLRICNPFRLAQSSTDPRRHMVADFFSLHARKPVSGPGELQKIGRNVGHLQTVTWSTRSPRSARSSSASEFFRTYQPPTLAVWGKRDPFFFPAGAEAVCLSGKSAPPGTTSDRMEYILPHLSLSQLERPSYRQCKSLGCFERREVADSFESLERVVGKEFAETKESGQNSGSRILCYACDVRRRCSSRLVLCCQIPGT